MGGTDKEKSYAGGESAAVGGQQSSVASTAEMTLSTSSKNGVLLPQFSPRVMDNSVASRNRTEAQVFCSRLDPPPYN